MYDASDEHLLAITESVAKIATKSNLKAISNMYDGVTIELVDQNGIVFASTDPTHVDFNMASGEQSAEFLCLLKGDKSYVQEYQAIAADSTVFMKYAGVATDFGFIQVGYNTKQLQNEITSSIQDITKNRHIGETGYVMILT